MFRIFSLSSSSGQGQGQGQGQGHSVSVSRVRGWSDMSLLFPLLFTKLQLLRIATRHKVLISEEHKDAETERDDDCLMYH